MSTVSHFENQEVLIQFDENAFESGSPAYNENFGDQVHEAQEQLLQLRQKQEQIERQKAELEELHRKKDQFITGRTELTDRLTRSITHLEKEALEAQRRVDEYIETKETFEDHLRSIQNLRPELWSRQQLRSELSRALGAIEDAEDDYLKSKPILERAKVIRPKGGSSGVEGFFGMAADSGFWMWFKCGLAFTLPLVIFGALFLVFCLLLPSL